MTPETRKAIIGQMERKRTAKTLNHTEVENA